MVGLGCSLGLRALGFGPMVDLPDMDRFPLVPMVPSPDGCPSAPVPNCARKRTRIAWGIFTGATNLDVDPQPHVESDFLGGAKYGKPKPECGKTSPVREGVPLRSANKWVFVPPCDLSALPMLQLGQPTVGQMQMRSKARQESRTWVRKKRLVKMMVPSLPLTEGPLKRKLVFPGVLPQMPC